MAQQYYMVLTAVGAAKKANKEALGQPLQLTQFAVGDGNGVYVAPDATWTTLSNEVYRASINQIYVDPNNSSYLVVEGIIPQDLGALPGFYVREIGIFDIDGDMIMVGAYPQTYKPTLAEGAARDLYIRAITEIGSAASVTLKIDPAIVVATRNYVDSTIEATQRGKRNYIINGNFDIWQRGGVVSSFTDIPAAAGTYYADRWLVATDGVGQINSVSGQPFTPGQIEVPGNPEYFFRYQITTAATGQATNVVAQRIENVRSLAGKTVTVLFYARGAQQWNLGVQLQQVFGTGGTPSATVFTAQQSVPLTTSFQKYTLTFDISSIVGKTLGTDNNDFLQLNFIMPTNVVLTFDLAQVQVEEGSVATEFQQRPVGEELALCQRYYQKRNDVADDLMFSGNVSAGWNYYASIQFTTVMRAVPAVTLIDDGGSAIFPFSSSTALVSEAGLRELRVPSSSGAGIFQTIWIAEAEL